MNKLSLEITQIVSFLVRELSSSLDTLYGFGSFFSEQSNLESDIDLAILLDKPLNPQKRWELQEKLAALIKKNVDLVDLRSSSLVMQFQIISSGTKLFSREVSMNHSYETYIYSAYCRFNVERKEIIDHIFKQGSIYAR